jgi:hypothetical protein
MEEHWFDALNKALLRLRPRRTILRAAVPSLALGAVTGTAVAKRRKKQRRRKRKGRKKPKPIPNPRLACSGGRCDLFSSQTRREDCEATCELCDFDDAEFCIDTTKEVADCCFGGVGGEKCCGNRCCGDSQRPEIKCCGGTCANLNEDHDHCNGCNQACPVGASCVNGGCECPPGQTVCDGRCVDLLNDKKYCGSCLNVCRGTNECCQGIFCFNTEIEQECCPAGTHLGTCRRGDTCCDSPTCAGPGETCR